MILELGLAFIAGFYLGMLLLAVVIAGGGSDR